LMLFHSIGLGIVVKLELYMQKDTQDFLFYGLRVRVKTDCLELANRLRRDFSQFLALESGEGVFLFINARLDKADFDQVLPKGAPIWNSAKVIVYEEDGLRYCDYHQHALSTFDFSLEEGRVISENIERLHEITYLMILSRIGKKLDLEGLHRLHACGFAMGKKIILLTMDMGGGKSTLLLEVARSEEEISILSDDTVLIDYAGAAHAFATRVGLPLYYQEHYRDHLYQLERREYGQKVLLPVESLGRSVWPSQEPQKIQLLFGTRSKYARPNARKISRILAFIKLIKPMVLGVGLAMIVEYFWESGLKDFKVKTTIALARAKAAWKLSGRAHCWRIELGTDRGANSLYIREKFGR